MDWRQGWKLVRDRERYLVYEINSSELVVHLSNCLTADDREAISVAQKHSGRFIATKTELIPRLRRRGPKAFTSFVAALRLAGFSHAAQLLDPRCEVNGPLSSSRKEEGVTIPGVVADIRIEVCLHNINSGERLLGDEKSICDLYEDSANNQTTLLRRHLKNNLDKNVAPYMVFVKTTWTKENPLILIFRLSNVDAAEKLWNDFESGALKTTIKEVLSTFHVVKDKFENTDVDLKVDISKDNYEKVIRNLSLQDPEHLVFVDGMEKRDLILKDHQVELAQPALEGENTIICAPTGTGKTFVAMEVMKRKLESGEEKKIGFIVNTVSLVQQQQQRFETYLPEGFGISSLCGSSQDISLSDVLKESNVVVLTAQVLLNALKRDVAISDFSLLVFDECHHTKKEHPYNVIMRDYYVKQKIEASQAATSSSNLPQIVGLSASLGIGTGNVGCGVKARQHLMTICANLDAHGLKIYDDPKQEICTKITPKSNQPEGAFQIAVNSAMTKIEEILSSKCDSLGKIPFPHGNQPYENWVVSLQQREPDRDLLTCAEHLNHYNNALMINEVIRAEDAILYLSEKLRSTDCTEIERRLKVIYEETLEALQQEKESHAINPGLQTLKEALLEKFASDDNVIKSKGIIFVGTRLVAEALVKWIKNLSELKDIVKNPSRLIGCGPRNGQDGMPKAKQDQEIKKFRDGDCNVIVATSALLEGIDIPECNFAINYGMPGNEITLVQARGRVRMLQGVYQIIVPSGEEMLKERDLSKEKLMKEMIAKIANQPSDVFQNEVNHLQRDAYNEHLMMLENESGNKKPPVTDDVKFHCFKCKEFACDAKYVKLYSSAHIVPNYQENLKGMSFKETTGKIMCNLMKTGEISCVKCHQRWGNMAKNKHGEFPLLKIRNFRVRSGDNDPGESGASFKQWKDFPYQLQKFDPGEVPSMAAVAS